MTNELRVLGLEARNYMALTCVELALGPDGLIVSGPNGSGKSSILSILEAAIGGKAHEPPCPVKAGEWRGEIAVILGNGGEKYRIEKVFESGRPTKLVVTLADGTRAASPQKLLDGLYAALSFDPAEFVAPPGARTLAAAEKAQAEMLLRACPLDIDLAEHERRTESKRAARTDVTRERKRLETVMASMRRAEVPDEIDVGTKSGELTAANKRNATIEAAKRKRAEIDSDIEYDKAQIVTLQAQIAQLQLEIDGLTADRVRVEAWANAAPIDVSGLERAISEAAATNTARAQAIAGNARLETTRAALDAERAKEHALDEEIRGLDEAKAASLARAAFPVPGMSIEGERIVVRTDAGVVPFAQVNTATKYVVAFAVLSKLHPTLRTAVVKDGNAFDPGTLGAMFDAARAAGFQLIVERIAGGDCAPCVEIRAGDVVAEARG